MGPCKHYWNGYTGTLPITDNEKASFPAQGTNRYFNGNGVNLYAVNACRICPNANEATLYAFRGDPHWDGKTLWVMNYHLYIGGMWFKKLQYIEGGYASPVTRYPDGHDYRQNSEWRNWDELTPAKYHDKWINRPAQGKPQNTSKYFFLPAMGYLDNHNSEGQLKIGAYGTYFGFYNGLQRCLLDFYICKKDKYFFASSIIAFLSFGSGDWRLMTVNGHIQYLRYSKDNVHKYNKLEYC